MPTVQNEIDFIFGELEKSGNDDSEMRIRKVLRGERPTVESVTFLYGLIAAAKSIRCTLRKDFLHRNCEEMLQRLEVPAEEIKRIHDTNPIMDNYDPSFLDIHECIQRVEDASIPFEYGLPWAKKVLETGLGTAPLAPFPLQQLWFALGFYWEGELVPNFSSLVSANTITFGQDFSACAPKAARDIQLSIVKFVNEMKSMKWNLDSPARWSIRQELDFRS